MVTIAVHGGPAPRDAVRGAVEWGRVVVATLARGVVVTLLGLALWAAAPAVVGWHPTTVMTGSMEPRLRPGDVVVSRPVPPAELRLGQVLLADDPDQPRHLRLHRAVTAGPDGTIVTKGDANSQRDSTPIARSAVHGVAVLRIPVVATPIVWMRTGEWTKVALLALVFAATLWLCTVDGSLRRAASSPGSSGSPGDDGDDGDDRTSGPDATSLEALLAPPAPPPSTRRSGRHVLVRRDVGSHHDVGSRRAVRQRQRRRHRLGRGGAVAAVLVVAGSIGVLMPAQAIGAPFTTTTVARTGTMTAATPAAPTALKCTPSGSNAVTISWTAPADQPFGYSVLANGTQVTTAGPTATSSGLTPQGLLDLGSTYKIQVRADFGSTLWNTNTTSTSFVNVRVLNVLGLISVTCA
ncbi:hypothetical protein ASG04_09510 [Curtobacterium sp. Leaf183]|uniref:hypothetical protein n=1 Tax=Curtobacterium sp. Leaf183 TaxID=1736291 RepID=UPI0006FF68DA|nr:hypothetical protein [Curtobacterium sp. Leaf183]KQS09112.1 hypothetical protein ASG04_09510 [Curtobacterium sp. Leaf183]